MMFKRTWALALTRFLTSFNDNAFKTVAMFVTLEMIRVSVLKDAPATITPDELELLKTEIAADRDFLVAFGAMVFMLPFVMFPTISGWFSDCFSKRKVLIATKWMELGVMFLGLVGYMLLDKFGYGPLLFAVFLMALQSTFLSPAFYGILPETYEESEISGANGIIQLVNFLGIILGAACGVATALIPESYYSSPDTLTSIYICIPFLLIALAGVGAAWFIGETNSKKSTDKFGIQLLTHYFTDFKVVAITRPIWLCVLGSAFFFSVGSLMMTSLMSFGLNTLGLSPELTSMLTVSMALGIGLGSFVAGQYSSGRIEFGLVPIGALGMTVFFIHLMLTRTFEFGCINSFALGFFGGFFVIPLTVYIQEKAPEALRGKILAQANAVSFIGMLAVSIAMLLLTGGIAGAAPADASFFTKVRENFFNLDTPQLYLGAAVCLVLACGYVFWLLPDFLLRLVVIILAKFVYRLRVRGLEHVPSKGPAVLVANRVSYVDALLLAAACPRSVHFFISGKFPATTWLRRLVEWAQVVSLPAGDSNPEGKKEAIAKANELLNDNEIICIFPEERLTTNGLMSPFQGDHQDLLPEGADIPIIPVHLGLLWGSIFSLYYGTVKLRRPRHLPYPVNVTFGKILPADCTPQEAYQAVAELAVESEMNPGPGERILPWHFIKLAHRNPFSIIGTTLDKGEISAIQLLIRSYVASFLLRKQCDDEFVGFMLPNCSAAGAMGLGAMLADRTPVFLNFTAGQESIDYAVKACRMSVIFTSRAFLEKLEMEPTDKMVFLEDIVNQVSPMMKIHGFLAALLPAGIARRRYFPKHAASVDSLATIVFSSGSTGQPKGVMLSHHNLTSNVNALVRTLAVQRSDALLGTLPFFHSFGFLTAFWLPLTWGIKVAWHPSPLDADAIGEIVEKETVTLMLATPTFLQAYTRKCSAEQFKSLRLIVTGAEKLTDKVAKRFQDKFGIIPTEGYGATELSPVVALNLPEEAWDIGQNIGREGAIGKALVGVQVKVVDPDTFSDLDTDTEGLLLVRGPNVMQGYLAEPEKTAEVIRDGWYITGDMARIDADGYIYITGRLSRFSKIGGEMVPHIAIEEELNNLIEGHDMKLVITAVPDPAKGERLIVLHLPLDVEAPDLIKGLREKGLPNLWIPKPKDFYEIEKIPVLGSGKLDLKQIRDLATEVATS